MGLVMLLREWSCSFMGSNRSSEAEFWLILGCSSWLKIAGPTSPPCRCLSWYYHMTLQRLYDQCFSSESTGISALRLKPRPQAHFLLRAFPNSSRANLNFIVWTFDIGTCWRPLFASFTYFHADRINSHSGDRMATISEEKMSFQRPWSRNGDHHIPMEVCIKKKICQMEIIR